VVGNNPGVISAANSVMNMRLGTRMPALCVGVSAGSSGGPLPNRTSQVRAQRVQHERTFFQGLEHQSEVELLEIAKSTVEQLGLAA